MMCLCSFVCNGCVAVINIQFISNSLALFPYSIFCALSHRGLFSGIQTESVRLSSPFLSCIHNNMICPFSIINFMDGEAVIPLHPPRGPLCAFSPSVFSVSPHSLTLTVLLIRPNLQTLRNVHKAERRSNFNLPISLSFTSLSISCFFFPLSPLTPTSPPK